MNFDVYHPPRRVALCICWGIVCVLIVFASHRYILSTTWGIGLLPDSVNYAKSARSIIAHHNLSSVGSHWPPLYPLSIAFCRDISRMSYWYPFAGCTV